MCFDVLQSQNATKLEELFREEEVFIALSDFNGDKALGLDGFSMAFWQCCWDFVKEKVFGFL